MKEAYFFSHDNNARRDPKILEMFSVYGAEGYGWYWILIEMMRDQDGYKLRLKGKYVFQALARELYSDPEKTKKFIDDCINEFELFRSDGEYFWSESLQRRMKYVEERSSQAQEAARKRWDKVKEEKSSPIDSDSGMMQTHSEGNADVMQPESGSYAMKGNERRGKESRGR